MWYESLLDRGLLPDALIRHGIRGRLAERLRDERRGTVDQQSEHFRTFVDGLRNSPIAIETQKANEQHYALPPRFFELCLGRQLKYSGCYWPPGVATLDQAEEAMLALTCERAQIEDGMEILDLGCGWGSFSLHVKRRFPGARVLAVSNSAPQRAFIEQRRDALGLDGLEVITADANEFETERRFDRIVSVEMFEHMKNYRRLLAKLSRMLRPDGRMFVHIFTHRELAYHYEESNDWIGRYFFSGGTMPSDDLLCHFQDDFALTDHWRVDGRHYERTANAWLANMDRNRAEIMGVLRDAYGGDAGKWWHRWRVFYMACAELWGYANGSEWIVSHYLFAPRPARPRSEGVRTVENEVAGVRECGPWGTEWRV